MTDDNTVRYNVQMPADLREDAKSNADRGELAEEVRDLFRRKAYGYGKSESQTELERKQAELESVRNKIDSLRHKRRQIDAKIEHKETRATRLEEQVSELEEKHDQVDQSLSMLKNMINEGERVWPEKIQTYADVDESLAHKMHKQLRDELPEIPDVAFEKPETPEQKDWRVAHRSR